ncbi:MAG: diguanylate cyclase [Capsulimonas sp.]|uniref:diguanylate cyclase n=1 Tax=Capsulimonas sp. TaxID=2494211 RepID=UPI00326685E3
MMTLPMPENETERLKWLHESRILDTPPEDLFDEVTCMAADLCGAPVAAIILIDAERQWFKSIVGYDVRETPRDAAFCAHTILQSDILIVPDARHDERFAQNPFVIGAPSVRFYAGAPLITSEGYALGSLCILDLKPRSLTAEQQVILRMLARQVASRIELQRQLIVQQQLIDESSSAQASLKQSEERLKEAQSLAQMGSWEFEIATRRISWSDELFHLLELAPSDGEPSIERLRTFYHPDDAVMQAEIAGRSIETGEPFEFDIRVMRRDGSLRWMHSMGRAVRGADGSVHRLVGTLMNIHERRMADDALRESENRLSMVLEKGRFSAWRLDLASNEFIGANAPAKALFGLSPDAAFTRADYLGAVHPDDRAYVQESMQATLEAARYTEAEFRVVWPDGSIHWLSARGSAIFGDDGQPVGVSGVMHDITDRKWAEAQREQALREAEERADRDPLTGLWNHRAFHKRLEEEAARSERDGGALTVAMIDVDNFQFFNDAYGHVIGDDVLRAVGARLQSMCRPYDTIARFGGDEFVLILPAAETTSRIEIERRLQDGLRGLAYTPAGSEISVPISATIGVSTFARESSDRHEVIRLADERLRRAKTGAEVETEADQVRATMTTTLEGFSMLDALVTAVDNKDRYTRRHSEDVMAYCLTIARAMGMSEEEQTTIGVAALLHDVGKIGVPDAVLRKPGRLTDFEYEAIQHHPQMGAAIVSTVAGLEAALDAVRHHHERWDGDGYPSGLSGTDIPLIARMMAVADAFSAMTTDRPYRLGMPPAKALSILENGAGSQWDPSCVRVFLQSFAAECERSRAA